MPLVSELYYYAFEGTTHETPPVVLLHGAGFTHLAWPPEVRRLPGQRLFALDLPGHGKSGGAGQQSVAAYADLVLAWCAAAGFQRAVFVGHDLGGAVALHLALHAPEQVVGLGLVSSGARLRVAPEILEHASSPTTFYKAVEALIGQSFASGADPRLVEQTLREMAATRPSVLSGDLQACEAFDVLEQIAAIRAPTLVVCGADDRLTPLRQAQYLAGAIPAARLAVIPQAGHLAPLEHPLLVAEALRSFLERLPYQAG
jgi:pimeloyl-ACP methyl ester carboxylesterase